jgi:hypothetical protein
MPVRVQVPSSVHRKSQDESSGFFVFRKRTKLVLVSGIETKNRPDTVWPICLRLRSLDHHLKKLKPTTMTKLKYFLLILLLVLTFPNIYAQEYTTAERRVQIFTPDEKDNLQMWFHNEIYKMEFTEEELDEYYAVIFYYVAKISRLDDLDKGYTKEEFKVELDKFLVKQEVELKEMLTEERYNLHTTIYAKFLNPAYKRWGIDE